ncbi:pectinesterase family protein [Pseudacidobacterium ailaaui]|jgi:polygalacturonase|uniref:pectinesterase family protein n=1 Tax=Pseudacidobacterium ailaaui TaxID=1382359 RepID=UPI0009DE96E1|nr:pectinesterase family protein [Pseudacidobacterium ailaaui]
MKKYLSSLVFVLLLSYAGSLHAQNTVHACAVLKAEHTISDASGATDTDRIQALLNECSPGRAVVLEAVGKKNAFFSRPLLLPRGVTLFIAHDVTLYASRNLRDYDLWPGSCGNANAKHTGCKPFLFAYQAAFSGVAGDGTIDGQNDKTLWSRLREQWKGPQHQGNAQGIVPDLVASYESQNFSVRGVHLNNAAGDSLAVYKTIALQAENVEIDAPHGSDGILLSNSPDARLSNLDIRVGGNAIDLRASILGGTSRVHIARIRVDGGEGLSLGDPEYGDVHDIHISDAMLKNADLKFDLRGTHGGSLRDVHLDCVRLRGNGASVVVQSESGTTRSQPASGEIQFNHVTFQGPELLKESGWQHGPNAACPGIHQTPAAVSWDVDTSTVSHTGTRSKLIVAQDGSGDYRSIQAAIDALPSTGGEIEVKPGVYREVVTIRKPHARLYGDDPDPKKTQIICSHTGPLNGGTFNSATVFVEADDDSISNITIANVAGSGKGQAVALSVTGDRAAFYNLRILGAQDTLFAASRYCYGDYGPCVPARQYFRSCYIAGNVDFIFGDAIAVFDHCELHGIPGRVMYTAQSRHTAEQKSAYLFDSCRLTADPGAQRIALGRPWRPYATVVYLHTQMDAPIIPAGWEEWPRFGVPSLPTSFYAEYDSTGPGADPKARGPYSHQLTATEAAQWSSRKWLAGEDGWDPQP